MTEQATLHSKPGLIETHQLLIAMSAIVLLVLPFVTTFNEFLTSIVVRFSAYAALQDLVVPIEGRMVAAILHFGFGMDAVTSGSSLIVLGSPSLKVYISWNCIGWQSLILLALTLLTGLRGSYTMGSKITCVLAGVEGTILMNLLRIASVVLVYAYAGYLPAIVFHDYGGTIMVVLWLLLFWHLAFNHVLKTDPQIGASR